MRKEAFLKDLGRSLGKLKREERRRQLEYFDELLKDMAEGGMSEEEAVEKLGQPRDLAGSILEQMPKESFRKMDVRGVILCCASLVCVTATLIFIKLSHSISFYVGGGDGPTSVFVAGRVGRPAVLYVVTALALGATAVHYVRKGKRGGRY